jgi:hypothetical protein
MVVDGRFSPKTFEGLVPLVFCLGMYVAAFGFTDWAWTHCGYVTIMAMPVFALVCFRRIVCNLTGQDMDNYPKSCLYWLIFPMNRLLPQIFPDIPCFSVSEDGKTPLMWNEALVACFIFVVNMVWMMYFTHAVIGQICDFLDVWCLTIKPDGLKRPYQGVIDSTNPNMEGQDGFMMTELDNIRLPDRPSDFVDDSKSPELQQNKASESAK